VAPQRLLGLATGGLVVVLNARQLAVAVDAPLMIVIGAVVLSCAVWAVALVLGWRRYREEVRSAQAAADDVLEHERD